MRILLVLLLSFSAFAVDKEYHRVLALKIKEYQISATSDTPNKAFVMFKDKSAGPDSVDYIEVSMIDSNVADGNVIISRPTSTTNGKVVLRELEKCQADYGVVQIQANRLIITTDRLPIRVTCWDSSDEYSEFYQTFKDD